MKQMKLTQEFLKEGFQQYKDYISSSASLQPTVKEALLQLLDTEEYSDRLALWQEMVPSLTKQDAEKISNPFFIGYGNPEADTLIFGMEKAIELDPKENVDMSRRLFFEESINNNLQWSEITKNEESPAGNIRNRPYPYYLPLGSKIYRPIRKKLNASHTWGMYAKFISALNHASVQYWERYHKAENFTDSMFKYMFQSEINHIPARKLHGGGLVPIRQAFLKNEFFKSFKNVLVTGRTYFKRDGISQIERTFEVKHLKSGYLARGKQGQERLPYDLFVNGNRKVVLVNQMSGSAGWSDEGILNLASLINEGAVNIPINSEKTNKPKKEVAIRKINMENNQPMIEAKPDRFRNNLAFISYLAREARRRIKDMSLEHKVKVVQCGEDMSGNYCWVYLKPVDAHKPTCQLVPRGDAHKHGDSTLLGESEKILGSMDGKIQQYIQKRGLR